MISLPTDRVQTILPEAATATRRQFLTPIPEAPGEFLLVLDNTSLDKIKRCHKAAHNYLVLGREPHAKNAALTFGGAIHEGLDIFHTDEWKLVNKTIDGDPKEIRDASRLRQESAVSRYFTENPAPDDSYRTLPNAIQVLKYYRQQCDTDLHPDYTWDIKADTYGPIIERAFELPFAVLDVDFTIDGVKVSRIHLAWSGRIDLIASIHGVPRVVDHKTSSIDGEQFIQSFQIASQTIGYVWAASQLWPDLNILGFCLNCIRFKKPSLTHQGALNQKGPKGGEAPLAFFRSYFDYSPSRIAEWRNDTILLIEDFLHSLSRNHFPLNDRACFDKFGKCPYHDVCLTDDPYTRERLLQSDIFKQVTWNPTTGRG